MFLELSRASILPISDGLMISVLFILLLGLPRVLVCAIVMSANGSFVSFGWYCLLSGEGKVSAQFSGPSETSLSLPLICVVLPRVVLKKRHREHGGWLRNFGYLVLWRISCDTLQSETYEPCVFLCVYLRFCFFRIVCKFISQIIPPLIMLFRNSVSIGLSFERLGSLLKTSIRTEVT